MELEVNFFLPERYKGDFKATKLEEKQSNYVLTVVEKAEKIPKELNGKKVVLNGYKEKLELIHHPTNGKLMYLEFYRRRWKEEGGRESFSNSYKLNPKGCKLTLEFGDFLKGLTGQERSKFFEYIEDLEDIWEENKSLV